MHSGQKNVTRKILSSIFLVRLHFLNRTRYLENVYRCSVSPNTVDRKQGYWLRIFACMANANSCRETKLVSLYNVQYTVHSYVHSHKINEKKTLSERKELHTKPNRFSGLVVMRYWIIRWHFWGVTFSALNILVIKRSNDWHSDELKFNQPQRIINVRYFKIVNL